MPITIDGNGTISGASTLSTTIASPTLTTPNINSAQVATVSGTAPLYAARAWVNFTTAMSDTNYAAVGSAIGSSNQNLFVANTGSYAYNTTSLARIGVWAGSAATLADSAYVSIAIFR